MNNQVINQVPLLDLKAQYSQIQSEVESAVLGVLRSGHYILGPQVSSLEEEVASFLGVKHAIGCANGTDALLLSLLALDIQAGDEVIVPNFTFMATASTVALIGATPVFADINPLTYNIDASSVESRISNRTKAIIVVHLYGQAAAMEDILKLARRHNLRVIEDSAQAFGSQYQNKFCGGIGDIGTHSFYPTKNISAAGDAGMLTTNDDELATRLRRIRVHGSSKRYYHEELGLNSRLDEIQAAILRIKLKHIANWNTKRAQIAQKYNSHLSDLKIKHCSIRVPNCIPESTHIYHQYTIQLINDEMTNDQIEIERNSLKTQLQEYGVSSEIYYPLVLHQQKVFEKHKISDDSYPHSIRATKSILCLPIYPELSADHLDYVIGRLIDCTRT